ncbi:hypothetical protein, partial [Actinomadura chibensis]|uniref:hypothetical protein n=1 Tax=Actinomadura chibensis TaxID=392828 RepID=UPI001C3F1D98
MSLGEVTAEDVHLRAFSVYAKGDGTRGAAIPVVGQPAEGCSEEVGGVNRARGEGGAGFGGEEGEVVGVGRELHRAAVGGEEGAEAFAG